MQNRIKQISTHILHLCLITFLVVSLCGCRKAPTRGYRSHIKNDNEILRDEPVVHKERTRSSRNNETNKKLSGAEVFDKYGEAVFMIFTSDGRNSYQGSGFFIGENGLAVSNYHVFEGTYIGSENIKLSYDNNHYYKVSDVIAKSKDQDYIVFRVQYKNSIYIPIAKTKPNIGEKVYAIGSPRGLENTFSSGEVSQWRGDYLMQINALIDHGSSGGALINEYGEAVGITSGTFYDGSQANLNYAWSTEAIKKYIE